MKEYLTMRFSRSVIVAIAMLASSAVGAFAQSTSGSGIVAPTPSNSGGAPMTNGTAMTGSVAAAANPRAPGATGQAVVPGDNSSIAGDRKATVEQKSGLVSGGK